MQTILTVAEQLGAKLKRASNEYIGPCPKCGGRDRFSLNIKKGLWHCRGCACGGDAIELVRHVLDYSFAEACRFVGEEHKLTAQHYDSFLPTPRLTLVPKASEAITPEPEPTPQWIKDLVGQIVGELEPIAGSPGEIYLRDVRKIDTAAIRDVLETTDAIGWHPGVFFNAPGHALHQHKLGCIVAVMTDPVTALPTGAISRTYLAHDGRKAGKAKTLGSPAGFVRLDTEIGSGNLYVAEGLETALAGMAARGFRPMWSTGSTSLMAALPVLGAVEILTVIADNDANGAGLKAARTVEARWLAAGKAAGILMPDAIGDLNDIVMSEAA